MIALTQVRVYAPAREYVARRREEGKTGKEAIRALKRHLIRTLYRLLNTVANRTAIAINTRPHRALHHIGVIEVRRVALSTRSRERYGGVAVL